MYDLSNLKDLNVENPQDLEKIKKILYFNEARPIERLAIYKTITREISEEPTEPENPVPNNEIWYTAIDYEGNPITIDVEGGVFADYECTIPLDIISNEYNSDGICVMKLSGDVKGISWWHVWDLESLYLPDCLENFGDNMIGGKLSEITFPKNLKRIGSNAFNPYGNGNTISTITLPESIEIIDDYAFNGLAFGKNNFINNSKLDEEANNYWGAEIYDYEIDGMLIRDGVLCALRETNKTEIIIPDVVTRIQSGVFSNCGSLTAVTMPNTVTEIDSNAFIYSYGLSDIIYNGTTEQWNNINKYDNWNYKCVGFVHCLDGDITVSKYASIYPSFLNVIYENEVNKSVINVTVLNYDTTISSRAFIDCTSLTDVTILDGIMTIGEYAFYNCTSLTNITIPDSVTSIRGNAFNGCSSLTEITIPDSVTTIDAYAFIRCTSLTGITIGSGVTNIGAKGMFQVFHASSALTSITVNSSNPVYDSRHNCNAIIETSTNKLLYGSNITIIPDSVTSIGDNAFQGCSSLTSITIPDSVTSIGIYAFNGCSSLLGITIPDGITRIGEYTFQGCSSLTSITIPDSVTSMGSKAFDGCSSLTCITSLNPEPPTIRDNTISSYVQNIYVPFESVDAYKTAQYWSQYADIIQAIPE